MNVNATKRMSNEHDWFKIAGIKFFDKKRGGVGGDKTSERVSNFFLNPHPTPLCHRRHVVKEIHYPPFKFTLTLSHPTGFPKKLIAPSTNQGFPS